LSGINQPFDWIVANCLKRCENLGTPINWELFYLAIKRYGLTDNKRYVMPKPISKPENTIARSSVDNIVRPHQDKKEPHPAFAQFYLKAMENIQQS
jgi:hypothetical protein